MKIAGITFSLLLSFTLCSENWIEIGANPEATFFIDLESVNIKEDSVTIVKKGVYNNFLTEILDGKSIVFNQTIGLIEMDCKLKVNRVIQIKMLNDKGDVVWSSGMMMRRQWESVKKNSHAESTFIKVCDNFHQT